MAEYISIMAGTMVHPSHSARWSVAHVVVHQGMAEECDPRMSCSDWPHAWPTLSTGETFPKGANRNCKSWRSNTLSFSNVDKSQVLSSNICKLYVEGPSGTSDDIQTTPRYPGFQWLLGQWMTPYLGRKLLATLERTPPVSQLSLGTTSTNAAMNRKFT